MPRAGRSETSQKAHEQKFLEGLLRACGDADLANYEYYGGDTGSRLRYLELKLSERDDAELTIPRHACHCACGHDIIENCYLRHKPSDRLVVVGSCCVKQFIPGGLARQCSTCGSAHRNRNRDLCNACWPKCHRCNAKLYDGECGRCWWD